MDQAKYHALSVPIRQLHACLFTATVGAVIDAGPGRSFVGYLIDTALASSTGTMTFKGKPPTTELDDETDPTTLYVVYKKGGDGAAAAAYTEKPEANTGYFPLDPTVFNGMRWLQPIHADSQTGTIYFVSKPL